MFSDPPGAKIGNGGATMHVLEQMKESVGWEELKKSIWLTLESVGSNCADHAGRVLLLHAGGYSQRLPSVSVVGKIFMGIPCGMLLNTRVRKG